MELSVREAAEIAHELVGRHRMLAAGAAVSLEAVRRADAIGVDAGVPSPRSVGPGVPAGRAGWGVRRSLRFAVEQHMLGPEYLRLYARYLAARLRCPGVEFGGMVFLGRRVELALRRRHARLSLGPWCWVGNDNRLRAHEGNLRLGAKVVLGSDNVVNCYLDVEIGQNCLLSDWIYVCDFDHAYEDPTVPIRKQGIRKTPVRIGEDVWIGEKASILRGADIGAGSVIASQALVRGPIPPFSIAVGSPAQVVRSRLPKGMTAEEALDLQHRGRRIPGDPLTG